MSILKNKQASLARVESDTSRESAAPQTQAWWHPGVSRQRGVVGIVLFLCLAVVLGWQLYFGNRFWGSVWNQGTLFPRERGHRVIADSRANFDLSKATLPFNEIHRGGPPKDGIPALTDPRFIAADKAGYLRAEDRVIGFVAEDDARAYPLRILNYHEIVNDRVAAAPLAVTYCPLCDSAAIFDRRTPLGERDFGVSGLLYNSNVLMYDRGGKSESLWSQLKANGISGPAAELSLKSLPVELTTWKDWQSRYPETKVLAPETGYHRDYTGNPYQGYFDHPRLMFPAQPTSDRLPTKARVLGVWTDQAARAYPESEFSREGNRIEQQFQGKRVVIEFNPDARSLRVAESDEGVQWMYSFWFAWYAFRPETSVFESLKP